MEREIPRMPTGLKAKGKAAWKRAWASVTVTPADYDAVEKLAKLTDERHELDSWFDEHPRMLVINNGTNVVLHPYVKRIETIDKQQESLYDKLGLTPFGRAKLGLNPDVDDRDFVDETREGWAAEDEAIRNAYKESGASKDSGADK